MIHLTRLNHTSLVLNADLIESIEVTPDTVISLTTGEKLVVLEPVDEVVRRVVEFRRAIYGGILQCPYHGQAVCPVQADLGGGNLTVHGERERNER